MVNSPTVSLPPECKPAAPASPVCRTVGALLSQLPETEDVVRSPGEGAQEVGVCVGVGPGRVTSSSSRTLAGSTTPPSLTTPLSLTYRSLPKKVLVLIKPSSVGYVFTSPPGWFDFDPSFHSVTCPLPPLSFPLLPSAFFPRSAPPYKHKLYAPPFRLRCVTQGTNICTLATSSMITAFLIFTLARVVSCAGAAGWQAASTVKKT
ncbi:hypothetical protein EDB84DRAFT_853668 [Lactarius hengduanensis]|nr:hypothetical protein EDB84DRAFT_853668 [Lactarius hengduanensis]